MTTSQIIACAIAWTAAIVAVTAYVATRRARRTAATKWHIRWTDGRGELTTQQPVTEAEYETLKARWLETHGSTNTVCPAYRPPVTTEDSGLCARCGMFDYKHKERPGG